MTAPLPFLAMKVNGVGIGAYRVNSGNVTKIGGDLTGSEAIATGIPLRTLTNRVIMFRNNLYAWLGNNIFRLNNNVWQTSPGGLVISTGNLPSSENFKISGLYVANVNNITTLFGVYGFLAPDTTGVRIVKTTDGTTWSDAAITGTPTGIAGQSGIQKGIVHGDKFFFYAQGSHANIIGGQYIDLKTNHGMYFPNTFAELDGFAARDYVIWQNRLFGIWADNSNSNQMAIYEFQSNTWVLRIRFADTGNLHGGGGPTSSSKYTMFVDTDGALYLFYYAYTNPNQGWVVRKITLTGTGVGTFTDIGQRQSVVLPSELRYPTPATGIVEGGGWYVLQDDVSTPGSLVTWLLFHTQNPLGSTMTLYEWKGNLAQMVKVADTLSVDWAVPHCRAGGGNYFFTPGQSYIEIIATRRVDAGMQIDFVAYSLTGAQHLNIQFYFDINGNTPLTLCNLTDNNTGVLSAQTMLQDVIADNTTIRQVTWAFGTQDINKGAPIQIAPRIFA